MKRIKYFIYILTIIYFSGCTNIPGIPGSTDIPAHLSENFEDDIKINFDVNPQLSFFNSKEIRYKQSIDDTIKLGDGMLISYLDGLIHQSILRDKLKKNHSKKLSVLVDIKGSSTKKDSLRRDIKIFIDKNKDSFKYKYSKEELKSIVKDQKEHRKKGFSGKVSNISNSEADLILKVRFKTENILTLKLIPVRGAIVYFDEKIDLLEIKKRQGSKWIQVNIPDNMGNIDEYFILKNAVNEVDFFKNKDNKSAMKSITNIEYKKAKEYCQSVENGSQLVSIYVFEQARRDGLINKPYAPGKEEMIDGYNEFDDKYCIEEDILSLRQKKYNKNCKTAIDIDDMAEDDDSIEISGNELILFDWNRYEYWGASKKHTGANITFRCMKQ